MKPWIRILSAGLATLLLASCLPAGVSMHYGNDYPSRRSYSRHRLPSIWSTRLPPRYGRAQVSPPGWTRGRGYGYGRSNGYSRQGNRHGYGHR